MKSNELRIGNYVLIENEQHEHVKGVISWVKGMPIELDNIYFCLAEKNKCIAIWTDFRIQQMDQRTMEIIFGRISLLDCEFFMYHTNKRYRIGFRVKGVIK